MYMISFLNFKCPVCILHTITNNYLMLWLFHAQSVYNKSIEKFYSCYSIKCFHSELYPWELLNNC